MKKKKLTKFVSVLCALCLALIPATALAGTGGLYITCYYGNAEAASVGVNYESSNGKIIKATAFAGYGIDYFYCVSQSAQPYGSTGISATAKVRKGTSSTLLTATGKVTGF